MVRSARLNEELEVKCIINLTGHVVNILTRQGQVIRLDPDEDESRVIIESDEPVAEILGIRIHRKKRFDTSLTNLPDPEEGVIFVVSKYVCDAYPERRDLAYPDMQVRDGNRIIGCQILRLNG